MQSDSKTLETPQLATVIFSNLKEMVKAQHAAHESLLGFSWKKMWPFHYFIPQVDYLRVMRILEQVRQHTRDQKNFLQTERHQAPVQDATFLDLVPSYLDALAETCTQLIRLAQYKQDRLEKKSVGGIKVLNQLLLDYQNTQDNLSRHGAVLQKAWVER